MSYGQLTMRVLRALAALAENDERAARIDVRADTKNALRHECHDLQVSPLGYAGGAETLFGIPVSYCWPADADLSILTDRRRVQEVP